MRKSKNRVWAAALASSLLLTGGCTQPVDETGAARRAASQALPGPGGSGDELGRAGTPFAVPDDSALGSREQSFTEGDFQPEVIQGAPGQEHGTGGSGSEGTAAPVAEGNDSQPQLLSKLHHLNQMEIQMGELARANSASKQVRSYGEKLIRDHKKADSNLTRFSGKHRLTLATEPGEEMKGEHAKMEELKGIKGTEFDRKFTAMMVEGHQKAIVEVASARAALINGELKSLLEKLLPQLKDHKKAAEKLALSVGSKTAG